MKHRLVPLPQDVSRETSERLAVYATLLLKWNATINLIGRGTEADIQSRHIADSLQLVPLMPLEAADGVDLGSGAGFPGLVLAIATGVRFVLIEADQRKAAFLREAIAATGAPASVCARRIEAADVPLSDVVTARALAPLATLLGYAQRFLQPRGVALFLKGVQAKEEIAEAEHDWRMRMTLHQSATNPAGVVLELSEIHRVCG